MPKLGQSFARIFIEFGYLWYAVSRLLNLLVAPCFFKQFFLFVGFCYCFSNFTDLTAFSQLLKCVESSAVEEFATQHWVIGLSLHSSLDFLKLSS